jgi:hypothetical protein
MRFLSMTCLVLGFILLLIGVFILFLAHAIGAHNPNDTILAVVVMGGAAMFFVIAHVSMQRRD